MKKYAFIAGVVTVVGVVASSVVASAMFFNEPRIPSMLNK